MLLSKKRFSLLFLALFCITILYAHNNKEEIKYFSLEDVRLLSSPFKHAEELNKKYLLELDADRLLAPFLKEAG